MYANCVSFLHFLFFVIQCNFNTHHDGLQMSLVSMVEELKFTVDQSYEQWLLNNCSKKSPVKIMADAFQFFFQPNVSFKKSFADWARYLTVTVISKERFLT